MYEEQVKLIQLRRETYQSLKQHVRYYNHDEDGNVSSVDDLIIKLMNFYEQNYLLSS